MIALTRVVSVEGVLWAALSPVAYGFICIKANRANISRDLLMAFIAGFLTSYAAYLVELLLANSGFQISGRHEWLRFFGFVALPEEAVKLAALIGLTQPERSNNHNNLILACFIGCGFAASENVVYLQRFGEDVVATRFLTATAFHVFNAILMARVLVTKSIQDEALRIALALLGPVMLHATYDYLVVQSPSDGGRFVFVLGFAIAAGMTTLRTYRSTTN